MFERTKKKQKIIPLDATIAQLRSILTDYHDLANNDPTLLRLLIPNTDIWRIFVDGDKQKTGNWRAFEKREPGYISAMVATFNGLFDFTTDLNIDLIQTLHFNATLGVSKTNYDACWDGSLRKGKFRTNASPTAGSCISENNASVEGIIEVLENETSPLVFALWFPSTTTFDSSVFSDFHINLACIKKIRQLVSAHTGDFVKNVSASDILLHLKQFTHDELVDEINSLHSRLRDYFVEFIFKLGNTKTTREAAACLFDFLNNEHEIRVIVASKHPNKYTTESLIVTTNNYIAIYRHEMQAAKTKMQQLIAIVRFIHSCDQLHPFDDANTRTFCMLLLNHLLMKNGFPFTILENPNHFDCLSLSELLVKTIEGMENVFKLIKQHSLFNITTAETLAYEDTTKNGFDLLGLFRQTVEFKSTMNSELENRARSCRKRKTP